MKKTIYIAERVSNLILEKRDFSEFEDLKDWVMENENNQYLLNEFRQKDFFLEKRVIHNAFDSQKGFNKFLVSKRKYNKRKTFLRVTTMAALVVLFFSFTFVVRNNISQTPFTPQDLSGIMKNCNKAYLVLNSGGKIELHDSLDLRMSGSGVQLHIKGNRLFYQCEDGSAANKMHTIYTPRGGEYWITLADGTHVWLNAETTIQFPIKFSETSRDVFINGEAYFEVANDEERPFFVKTDKALLEINGSSLNVRAYKDDSHRTTLVAGTVSVSLGDQEFEIKAGEQFILDETNAYIDNVDIAPYLSWKDGKFAFLNQPLMNVFKELERWYDVSVLCYNNKIENMRFTGFIPRYEKIDKVLEIIEMTACVHFDIVKSTVIVNPDK